ncbi:MAG: AAA family ATPase [Polyangiales bacterium]
MPTSPSVSSTPSSASSSEAIAAIRRELERVILGKEDVLDRLLVALLSASHVLLEDVPGVGKTTLAKALARAFDGSFKRVQFTPDLLPSDIVGSSVYDPRDGSFTFKEGPVFANIVLADEINRASPRTQSALLEAMSEGQVSIEGKTRALPSPFIVLATQNPIEFHGTYPLPEAQLDRFGVRLSLGYPAAEKAVDLLYAQIDHHPLDDVKTVVDAAGVLTLQAATRAVRVDRRIGRYLVDLAEATRRHPSLRMGCSPRGTLTLFRLAQAHALLQERAYVVPEDAKAIATMGLSHRLALDAKARYGGATKDSIVAEVLAAVPVPV